MQLDSIHRPTFRRLHRRKRRAGSAPPRSNRHLNVYASHLHACGSGTADDRQPGAGVDALEEGPPAACAGGRLQTRLRIGAVAKAVRRADHRPHRQAERAWIEQARVVFLVVYGLGLRRGEVLGLRWRSVRLADPGAAHADGRTSDGTREDGPPKSATSRRTLVLDDFLAGELFDHRGTLELPRRRRAGVSATRSTRSALDHKRYAATFRAALERRRDHRLRAAVPRRPSLCDHERRRGRQFRARGDEAAGHSDFRTTQQYLDLRRRRLRRGGGAGRRSSFRPCASGKSWGNGRGGVAREPSRGDRTRTCNPRFWRPVLYRLSYSPGLRHRV